MNFILYAILAITTCTLLLGIGSLYVKIRIVHYLKKIITYGDGFADIQARIKDMALEHHSLMEKMIIEATDEIVKHVSYTNRWQKVMAKMISVHGAKPLEIPSDADPQKEAEVLHEIGLDIAKVAFEEKQPTDKAPD